MKQAPKILVFLLLAVAGLNIRAQQAPAFSIPLLKLQDGGLLINYDILNSSEDQLFNVRIEISDENGKRISAKSLFGDVGENVSGGKAKTIRWDMAADNASRLSGLYVQVFGEMIISQVGKEAPGQKKAGVPDVSKGGAMLRSLAYPGWGLTKLNPGSKHWVKGLAGYASLAGAGTMYYLSNQTYLQYQDSYDSNERSQLLEKSESQETVAYVLFGTAAAIWISDLVWTFIASGNKGPVSMGSSYDAVSGTPMLALRLTF